MNLLELEGGNVSLEYRPAEAKALTAALRRAGRIRVQKAATHDIVSLNGMSFIAVNEWDDPCLISHSPAGAAFLRALAAPDTPITAAAR